MNKRVIETVKPVTAISRIEPGLSTDTESRGISMRDYRKALVVCRLGNQVSADTDVVCQVREADNAAGATARNIGNAATTPEYEFARVVNGLPARASIITIFVVTPALGDDFTINGVTFTAVNTGTDIDAGQWDHTTSDIVSAEDIAACINNLLPDLVATDDGAAVVTVQARNAGETISLTDVNELTNTVPTLVEGMALLEVDVSALSEDYEYIVVSMETTGTSADAEIEAEVILGDPRYTPEQNVAGTDFS